MVSPGFRILQEIVFPIIMKLLTALCVPYVLARCIFPVLGYPLVINSAVYRYAWLGCLGFSALCLRAKRFHVWFTNLHSAIRDDRYLTGRRLHNCWKDTGERQNEQGDENSVEIENPDTIRAGLLRGDHGARQRHPNQQEA